MVTMSAATDGAPARGWMHDFPQDTSMRPENLTTVVAVAQTGAATTTAAATKASIVAMPVASPSVPEGAGGGTA